ncbi:PREDICTED: metabotropic glutamate receptor-like, partial [Priapulus caudatus]|uniref:Metabotropic glutamate receptor-like n=1 Tax=Priapulus caudatus TaxID=37621 RepID=A0ABM1EY64_PRICU
LAGTEFHFALNALGEQTGDGIARYNIIHFRRNVVNSTYEWVKVGKYYNGLLTLNMSEVRFRVAEPAIPLSACSPPCGKSQKKTFQMEGDICCWYCVNCSQYQIPINSQQECFQCPNGFLPSEDRNACIAIPENYLHYDSVWAISVMCFSTIGIGVTGFVFAVFVKYSNTPVVKASGRELSFVLLAGILLCYAQTFLLVFKPTDVFCTASMFGVGFSFSVCYAALLTKTNRIARIFNSGKRSAKRPSFISPKSQILICFGLVSVQVLVSGIWMFVSPPSAEHLYPTEESNELICSASKDATYMIVCAYPVCLMVVCTLYAVLTRKIPEAFNESKFIGFTMYTTCILWLAFVPIYLSTQGNLTVRIITMCIVVSLSGTVSLICLFTPKMYIIVMHPERNVRQSMMTKPASAATSSYTKQPSNVHQTSSSYRVDSGTQSDDLELTQRLCPAGSYSSISRSTSATQTVSNYSENGITCSTQTLNSVKLPDGDVGEGDVLL